MMKTKILLACLLLSFNMVVCAQNPQLEYRSFASEGKVWKNQVGAIEENVYCNQIDGDTIINGENWKKVYNYISFSKFNYSYYAAIRDVGMKVYVIVKGCSRPRLLYDFGLKKGDVIRCGIEGNALACLLDAGEQLDTLLGFPFVSYLKVERIDTIKARGLQHRRFILSMLDAFKEYHMNGEEPIIGNIVWIEGVGSGAGPFSPWIPLPPQNFLMQFCDVNKVCLFGYPDFYEIYETNGINGSRFISNTPAGYYDLQGRMMQHPNNGINIHYGKKQVVKQMGK